jgi:phospholipid transport system substrate-binding protein
MVEGVCRTLRSATRLTVALTLLVVSAAPALAGTPTERIREFFGSVNRVIGDPGYDDLPQERFGALRRLVVDVVDFRNAAALALGPEWGRRTPAEREEFIRYFGDLLQTSVFASVGSRARVDNGLVVTYIGELSDREDATVSTSVLTRSGGEMGVGYRMLARDGRWMVYDVVVDGVSLIENYRAQFQKVIHRSSYPALVNEMRARITDLSRSNTATVATTVTMPAPTAAPAREVVVEEPKPALREVVPVEPPRAAPRMTASLVSPPRPVPPAIRRAVTAPVYWVQVGAFSNTNLAMRVADTLHDQPVSLLTAPGHPLMRVLVGPFASRDAAEPKLRELRTRGYGEAFISSR